MQREPEVGGRWYRRPVAGFRPSDTETTAVGIGVAGGQAAVLCSTPFPSARLNLPRLAYA